MIVQEVSNHERRQRKLSCFFLLFLNKYCLEAKNAKETFSYQMKQNMSHNIYKNIQNKHRQV